MVSNWNDSALNLVGDYFLLEPLYPRWMSLFTHHKSQVGWLFTICYEDKIPRQTHVSDLDKWVAGFFGLYDFSFRVFIDKIVKNFYNTWKIG